MTTLTTQQAVDCKKNNIIPDGWYVHGRSDDRNDLITGWCVQLTKDYDTAYQYGGEHYLGDDAHVWFVRPKEMLSWQTMTRLSIFCAGAIFWKVIGSSPATRGMQATIRSVNLLLIRCQRTSLTTRQFLTTRTFANG